MSTTISKLLCKLRNYRKSGGRVNQKAAYCEEIEVQGTTVAEADCMD